MGIMDSYDDTKKMLATIRRIQLEQKMSSKYGTIQEQVDNDEQMDSNQSTNSEEQDFAVINNVEIEIHSEDPEDLEVKEDEKGKISQLIDDFRSEVSEIVEFGKLHIYNSSAKLDGKISDIGIGFTLSTGDDTGLYLTNTSLLKIDDNSLDIINKLKLFEDKFSTTINELLMNRRNS